MQISVLDRIIRASGGVKPGLGGRMIALLFGGVFFAGGAMVFWSMVLSPIGKILEAQSWEAVRGTVQESKVEWDGDSGKVYIRYTYAYGGESYEGDRYQFDESSTNVGTGAMEEVVAMHPVETAIDVWVDPSAPEESVISRKVSNGSWIGIPFSLPFLTVGVCGLGYCIFAGAIYRRQVVLRKSVSKRAAQKGGVAASEWLVNPDAWRDTDTKVHFANGQGWVNFLGLLAVCCFVCGIVAVFVMVMIMMFISGDGMAWFLLLFLIPFEIIAVGLLFTCARSLRTTKAPDFLILTKKEGESKTVHIEWTFLGMSRDLHAVSSLGWQLCESKSNSSLKSWLRKTQSKTNPSVESESIVEREDLVNGSTQLSYSTEAYNGLELEMLWADRSKSTRMLSYTIIAPPNDD